LAKARLKLEILKESQLATKEKAKVQRMEIEPHGKEGFSVVHHMAQKERGVYTMPETHIMKSHGQLLNHLHDHFSKEGSKETPEGERGCPFCGEAEGAGGAGEAKGATK
jgi:hypothetical protein